MKKVIRLTESDLTRIIKRVIKESETSFSETPIKKLKILNPDNSLKYNFTVYSVADVNNGVGMKGSVAPKEGGEAFFSCRTNKLTFYHIKDAAATQLPDGLHLTSKGREWAQQYCNQYVQSSQNNDTSDYA
jgi:hypothetical protein